MTNVDTAAPMPAPALSRATPDLRLGYVPLTDAAPLLVAGAKGFFRKHGLKVDLAAASSWSALRDRVAFGVWHGAQMLGPMPIAAALGFGGVRADLAVTATLGRGGNTLVLGAPLAAAVRARGGVVFPLDAGHLAGAIRAGTRPTLAVVFPFSSHNYLLRHFLAEAGLDPDRDVRLVVLPPPALPEALASGAIDGFCAGEPWGSRAVDLRVGEIAHTSHAIWPDHPEKVLALPASLAARDPARVLGATAAVIEAADWLSQPNNAREAAAILHQAALPGVPEAVVALALQSRLIPAPDAAAIATPVIRHGAGETYPDPAHPAWFFAAMRRWRHAEGPPPTGIWRPDLWTEAAALTGLAPIPLTDTAPATRSPTP